jgi:hypothetical protein
MKELNVCIAAMLRGIATFKDGVPMPLNTLRQMFGEGRRAGMYPISETECYWYTTFNAPLVSYIVVYLTVYHSKIVPHTSNLSSFFDSSALVWQPYIHHCNAPRVSYGVLLQQRHKPLR